MKKSIELFLLFRERARASARARLLFSGTGMGSFTIYLRFKSTYIGKGLLVSLFLILNGCTAPLCQQWQFDAIITPCPCYNSGRLTLPPADLKNVSLELVRGVSGVRLYLNTLSLPFPCDPRDPAKIQLTFAIDEVNYSACADRLEGGQRLLLPQNSTQQIIEALLENKTIHMTVGRYHVVIISTRFPELYQKFCKIPAY